MENQIETTLGHLVFYAKETIDGKVHQLEKLIVYHRRSLDDDDETVKDCILFASPNRCNLYGDALTNITDYDFGTMNYVEVNCLKDNISFMISRSDFCTISGIIDFLIYHQFATDNIRLDLTLDDADNYNNALKDAKHVVNEIKQDLSLFRNKKAPLFLCDSNCYKRCKLKLQFIPCEFKNE